MNFEALKKYIAENSESKFSSKEQIEKDVEFSKNVTDEDIVLMEKEAEAFRLMRKPRIYVILYIFFRYQIPIMYHRVINFINGNINL